MSVGLIWFGVSMLIRLVVAILRLFFYILKNALLCDFLVIIFLGYGYMRTTYHMDELYSGLIAAGIAIIVVLMMAKLKYIRIALLSGFGAFLSYQFFLFFRESIQIPNQMTFSLVISVIGAVCIFIWHIHSGLTYGKLFGQAYNPFAPLIWAYKKIKGDTGKDNRLDDGEIDAELEELFEIIEYDENYHV